MSKRYFKISLSGYGGELVVATASHEFVEEWLDRDDNDLLAEQLSDALEVNDDDQAYYDADPFVSIYAPYVDDCELELAEISNSDDLLDEIGDSEYIPHEDMADTSYRECLADPGEGLDITEADVTIVPVVVFSCHDSGFFGTAVIETNGEDFDPSKLKMAGLETNFGDYLEKLYYNGKEVEIDTSGVDTEYQDRDAMVGYIDTDEYDPNYS